MFKISKRGFVLRTGKLWVMVGAVTTGATALAAVYGPIVTYVGLSLL